MDKSSGWIVIYMPSILQKKSQYSLSYEENIGGKSYNYINRCRKKIWLNLTPTISKVKISTNLEYIVSP